MHVKRKIGHYKISFRESKDGQCDIGYYGPICGSCKKEDYYFRSEQFVCRKCLDKTTLIVKTILLLIIFVCGLLIFIL